MGRTMGSKNGQGGSGKQGVGSKQLINGRKTSNSTQKLPNTASTGGKANGDVLDSCCSESVSDRSQTNFPFDIRISGFSILMNTVRKSTPKVQKLILDECDIILECRVCRNLFRSLPNFLTHKQSFCKNQFHPSANSGFSQFIQNSDNSYEFQYHVDESLIHTVPTTPSSNGERSRVEQKNVVSKDNAIITEDDDSSTSSGSDVHMDSKSQKASRLHQVLAKFAPEIENATRTPSSLYSDIIMKRNVQGECTGNQFKSEPACKKTASDNAVRLHIEPVDKSSTNNNNGIVFQKTIGYDPSNCDVVDPETDCRKVAHPDTAVLGPDGKIICVGNSKVVEQIVNKVIAQVEELQDEQQRQQAELNCPECFTLFPTRKTLRMHVRAAHRSGPGPEQDEEQVTSDSKVPSDLTTDTMDDASIFADSEIKISSPPLKRCKSDSPVEPRSYQNDSALPKNLPLSPTKSNTQSGLVSALPLASSSSKSSSIGVRTLFLPNPKRPRGRPKKSSLISKKDTTRSDGTSGRRDSRSYSSDASDSLSVSRVGSPFSNPSAVQVSHDRQNPSYPSFTCGKCSAKFGTKSEMSMHLAHCAGVINYAFLRRPKSPENKISIQIRRDYLKPSISNNVQEKMGSSNQRSDTFSRSCTSNNLKLNSSSNFEWTRWNHDPVDSKKSLHNSSGVSPKPLTFEECIEIAKYKFYGTSPSCSNAISAFSNLNNNNRFKFQVNADLCDNDEQEDEENDDASTTGDVISSDSSEDDGLPDEDEKDTNRETEIDAEMDRDSNVTDSGVSTTSIIPSKCPNDLAIELEVEANDSDKKETFDVDHDPPLLSPQIINDTAPSF